jgi:RNA ligase (TIGR02306 family)
MRKLASIQKILNLEPIKDADAIEKATVLGWQLVVKKGEFQIGDFCVYCEIDSVMPERPEFEFLKPRKMRIKTVRLRGQISQGICFPLSILPVDLIIDEGLDVTDILGVIKYEEPIPEFLTGLKKGGFPSFIPKTDETRVQVLQDVLNVFKGEVCYVSEKIDGSSVTYFINKDEFGVCSRNMELCENAGNSFWQVAKDLDIENKLRSLNGNFAIQGELTGEGIQSNRLNLKGKTVKIFNLYDIDNSRYLDFEQFTNTINKIGLQTVPIIESDYILSDNIEDIIKKSVRRSMLNDKIWAEGIVIRPLIERTDVTIGRLSIKAVNPEYLLKYGD